MSGSPFLHRIVSRTAAIAFLAVIPAGAYIAGVAPVLQEHAAIDDRIARYVEAMGELSNQTERISALQGSIDILRRTTSSNATRFVAATPSLATAALQGTVRDLIQSQGGRLHSVQALKDEPVGDVWRVGASFQFTASSEPVLRIAHGIEANEPLLFIDDVEIRLERMPGGAATISASGIDLSVRLDVYGYAQPKRTGG